MPAVVTRDTKRGFRVVVIRRTLKRDLKRAAQRMNRRVERTRLQATQDEYVSTNRPRLTARDVA